MDMNSAAAAFVIVALLISIGVGLTAGMLVSRASAPACSISLATTEQQYRLGDLVHGRVEIRALRGLEIHSLTVSLLAVQRGDVGSGLRDKPVYRAAAEIGSPQRLAMGSGHTFAFQLPLPAQGSDRDERDRPPAVDATNTDFTLHVSLHCAGIDVTAKEALSVSCRPG
jgi:hypothetical protein